jgi:hypothetical protein
MAEKNKNVLVKMKELHKEKAAVENKIDELQIVLIKDVLDTICKSNIEAYIPIKRNNFIVINEELLLEFTPDKLIIIKELISQIKLDSIVVLRYETVEELVKDIIEYYRNVSSSMKAKKAKMLY